LQFAQFGDFFEQQDMGISRDIGEKKMIKHLSGFDVF